MENQITHMTIPIPSRKSSVAFLPVSNIRDMDSGVSSGYSAVPSGSSTPTDNNRSRRSSIYSERYECSTISRISQESPYFRQVFFDEAWEKSDIEYSQSQDKMQNTFCDHTIWNTLSKRIRGKKEFKNNKDEHLKGIKRKRSRLNLVRRRRKSVATRSKVV